MSRRSPHHEVSETANKVVNLTIESASEVRNGLGLNLRDALLDSVDLEVGHAEFVGKLSACELLGLTQPLDTPSNAGRFLHDHRDISGPDISRQVVSTTDTQVRDNVGHVERSPRDISFEQCLAWVSALDGDLEEVRLKAKVKSTVERPNKRYRA